MVAYPLTTLPNTAHTVYYAYSIIAGQSGVPIGSFEKFGSSFTRTHERIREILFNRGPITKEIIWANTDIQVTLTKVELFKQAILQAFGFEIYTIEQFNQVVDVVEVMAIPPVPGTPQQPAGTPNTARYVVYKDCVPTNVTKDVDTTTPKVNENLTLECRTVEGYVGPFSAT
jgi:hypothetical protein